MKGKRAEETFPCPHCGAGVPVGARVCRECGSDEETGWSEESSVGDGDIATGYGDDNDFDYDEFIERELPDRAGVTPRRGLTFWAWRIVIALLCLGLAWVLAFGH